MPVFNDPHFPPPGEKSTWKPSLGEPSRAATEPAPLKDRMKLADVQPPPQLFATDPAEERSYEPYNPYARPKPKPRAHQRNNSRPWVLIAATTILVIAGILLVSTFFVQREVEAVIAKQLTKAVKPYESVADVKFSGVKVSLFRQVVRVRDVAITLKANEEVVHIANVSVWGIDWKTLKHIATTHQPVLPEEAKIELDGVKFRSSIFGANGQAMLESMGYQEFSADLYANVARTKSTFDLRDFELEAAHIGKIDMSFSLGSLSMPTSKQIATWKKDPRLVLTEGQNFMKATINGFELTFKDDSITEHISEQLVKMGETSPLDLARIAYDVNAQSRHADFVKPALQALVAFLEHPSQITVRAQPRQPVRLVDLFDDQASGSINDLAHKLNMSIY